MTELKMIDETQFFIVNGAFRKKYNLKGNELMIYSIIYGFSQGENHWFHGSRAYLSEWTGTSVRAVSSILDSLVEKKLIVKRVEEENGIRKCFYRAAELLNVLDQINYGMLDPGRTSFDAFLSEED